MNEYGFSLDVLMELAGQSVAHTTHQIIRKYYQEINKNIFVIAGPGSFFYFKKIYYIYL